MSSTEHEERKPSRSGILHDATVEGIVFYSTLPKKDTNLAEEHTAVKSKKNETIWREAEAAGYRRGLKEGHQQGYEAGRSEGYDIGLQEGRTLEQERLRGSVTLLKNATSLFQSYKEEMFEQAKPELIRFTLAVCEKMLRNELSNPSAFAALLEKLFLQAKSILKVVPVDIVLAPEDLKMLENNMAVLDYTNDELKNTNFIADSTLERGNCRLETAFGLINFDIARLLHELEIKTLES